MKTLALSLVLLASLAAHAEERVFRKVSADQAEVSIKTEDSEGVQAAAYVDGSDNQAFIDMMLADPASKLAQLVRSIEVENCGEDSVSEGGWISGCGEVHITSAVMTSFGRGGWMGGGAVYTLFVGFRHDGTGHFFDASHMVRISEGVEAQVDEFGEYTGRVLKSLDFAGVTQLAQ